MSVAAIIQGVQAQHWNRGLLNWKFFEWNCFFEGSNPCDRFGDKDQLAFLRYGEMMKNMTLRKIDSFI